MPRAAWKLLASLLTIAVATLLPSASVALADDGVAERMFREGRALMLQNRFDDACPMLEESQRRDPHVGTLLNVAACREHQGRIATAWVAYQKVLTTARSEGQREREQLAAARLASLEPRVPWLRISSTSDDLTIALDGSSLVRAAWGQEMPVDPGARVVTAEQGGVRVFEERIDLREGERRSIVIDVPASVPAVPSLPERVVIEPATPPATLPGPSERPNRWVLEPGIFVAYVGGSAEHAVATDESSYCASQRCGALRVGGGVAGGATVFGGYAISDSVDLGVRLLLAPSLGNSAPSVTAGGPAITFRPTEAFSLGAWGFFGDATLKGTAVLEAPTTLGFGPRAPAQGELAGGFGVGGEISFRLFRLSRGDVRLYSTPMFLRGSGGSAVMLPIGVAYRFQ